jgi:hypothetical protein
MRETGEPHVQNHTNQDNAGNMETRDKALPLSNARIVLRFLHHARLCRSFGRLMKISPLKIAKLDPKDGWSVQSINNL